MRLGTCIALELVVAMGAVGGVWIGVDRATELAGTYLETRRADAATPIASRFVPTPLPRATIEVTVATPIVVDNIFGSPDATLLEPLGTTTVTKLKTNHGGTSLSLRVDFETGARAAFKPEQTHPQSDPRREIAAYRLDRLLGIGRVPPAKSVVIPVAELVAAAEPSHRTFINGRLADEGIIRRDASGVPVMRGELSWWVPEIKLAKIGPYQVDEKEGKALWAAYLQVGAKLPEEHRAMLAQIAAVIVFDVLIDNPDRWSGGNAMMSPDGKTLFFMDNTMSFSNFGFGHEQNLLALRRIQVFPRTLVEKLRTLTMDDILGAFGTDDYHGLAPLLRASELEAILTRRDNMLRYIDKLIEEHGEGAVLALP